MDGFAKRRELKKKKILTAALDLFQNNGVQKVAVAQIAEKAGVSQVTIYNYFSSKENLAHHTVYYYVDLLWEEAIQVFNSDLSFPEKIQQLIFNKKNTAAAINEEFYMYLMKEYMHGSTYMEDFYRNTALPKMMALFEEGRREGYVSSSVSNEAILFYMQMMQEHMQKEDVYSKILPMTEEIMHIFFYGIAGKNAEPEK